MSAASLQKEQFARQLVIAEKTMPISSLETYDPNGKECAELSCLRGTF
jgi:hypothetical protein